MADASAASQADLATLHLPGIIRLLLASPCTHRVVFIAEYTAESGLYARYIRGRPGEAMRICRALAAKIKWSADFNVEMTVSFLSECLPFSLCVTEFLTIARPLQTPDGEQLPATKSPLLPLEWLREYGYILRIICLTLLHANGATSVSACFPLSPSDREVFDNILWTGEELGVLFEGKTLPKEWGPDLLKYAQYFIGAVKLLKDALDPNRHFEGMMRCMTQEPGCGEMHKRFPWVVCSGLMLESCQIGIELDLEMKACQRVSSFLSIFSGDLAELDGPVPCGALLLGRVSARPLAHAQADLSQISVVG